MTVSELTREQLVQLKQSYLTDHLLEVEDRTPSYGELADADEIVPDAVIFGAEAATIFSPDDFV